MGQRIISYGNIITSNNSWILLQQGNICNKPFENIYIQLIEEKKNTTDVWQTGRLLLLLTHFEKAFEILTALMAQLSKTTTGNALF